MACRRRIATLLVAATVLASPAAAAASDFFGPSQGLQVQPELDILQSVDPAFRFILKIDPTWIPSESYGQLGFECYAAWLVAPFAGEILSPDLAKRRRLDVRVGAAWYPTTSAGTASPSSLVELVVESTVRTTVPGDVLATLRGRVEARWQYDPSAPFQWRLRLRPQLEREFTLHLQTRTSLTPFVNAEFLWTTSQDMWSQFRMQAGLQLGVHWFGAGQVLELNGSIYTYLQPSRSYAPVIGFVWYQYF
jgi:hypothetical protein